MDVIIVEAEIPDAILNESSTSGQDVRLVGLQDLLHQTLGYLVLRPGNSLLKVDAF